MPKLSKNMAIYGLHFFIKAKIENLNFCIAMFFSSYVPTINLCFLIIILNTTSWNLQAEMTRHPCTYQTYSIYIIHSNQVENWSKSLFFLNLNRTIINQNINRYNYTNSKILSIIKYLFFYKTALKEDIRI